MEFAEAKNEIIILKAELAQNEAEYKELNKIYIQHRKKMNLYINRKDELSKEIKKLEEIVETENMFESVKNIEGFDTLLQ
jgi:predicted acetyltransferase